mgnify:CR=1 FL=1|jgi:hypothetical protein
MREKNSQGRYGNGLLTSIGPMNAFIRLPKRLAICIYVNLKGDRGVSAHRYGIAGYIRENDEPTPQVRHSPERDPLFGGHSFSSGSLRNSGRVAGSGYRRIVSEKQLEYLEAANEFMRKIRSFKEIVVKPRYILGENDRNSFSEKAGLSGYLLRTPGHSEDSNGKIKRSWAQIIKTNERTVFPGHGRTLEI